MRAFRAQRSWGLPPSRVRTARRPPQVLAPLLEADHHQWKVHKGKGALGPWCWQSRRAPRGEDPVVGCLVERADVPPIEECRGVAPKQCLCWPSSSSVSQDRVAKDTALPQWALWPAVDGKGRRRARLAPAPVEPPHLLPSRAAMAAAVARAVRETEGQGERNTEGVVGDGRFSSSKTNFLLK